MKLFETYPKPWRVLYEHERHPNTPSAVQASNGSCVMTMETHSGDGDFVNLKRDECENLVQIVNAYDTKQS